MVATADGHLIVSVEGRRESQMDWGAIDVLVRSSDDGGSTWTPPRIVQNHQDFGPGPCNNFVMIPLPSGSVRAVFCHDYARAFTAISHDQGQSFVELTEITDTFEAFRDQYAWQVIATGPGHGLRLSSGRLIVPSWMSDGSAAGPGAKHRAHRPSLVTTIYSDDDGASWHPGEIVVRDGDTIEDQMVRNPSESVAAQRSDGSVIMNTRSDSDPMRRLWAVSPDGISRWQVRGFDPTLVEPICMGSMIKLPEPQDSGASGASPTPMLFANPATLEVTMKFWPGARNRDRRNLTVFRSDDDGASWSAAGVLEPGYAAYSDLACIDDRTVVCAFENGVFDNQMGADRYLDVAVFDPEDLLNQ